MTDLISKKQMVEKINDLFLDKYEAKANSDLTEFYKEVLKILINEKGKSEWISVKDRLPEPFTIVLAYYINGRIHTVGYIDKFMTSDTVTHWMPPPQIPESEDAE